MITYGPDEHDRMMHVCGILADTAKRLDMERVTLTVTREVWEMFGTHLRAEGKPFPVEFDTSGLYRIVVNDRVAVECKGAVYVFDPDKHMRK